MSSGQDGSSDLFLDKVEASYQPLDFAFHPTLPNMMAVALVDGSIEIHDFQTPDRSKPNPHAGLSDDEDEHDSLLSSLSLHTQRIPTSAHRSKSSMEIRPDRHLVEYDERGIKTTNASCRTVCFSTDGTSIFSAGSAGDLVAVDADRACTFSMASSWQKKILWSVESATKGVNNPITVIHPFLENPSLIATGDDCGGIRLWDRRICQTLSAPADAVTSTGSRTNISPRDKELDRKQKKKQKRKKQEAPQRPPGCVLSWDEHDDYVSAIQLSSDEQTLVATSADCRLGIYDLRMLRETIANTPSFRLSDDQEDELLSVQILKHGKKVVCGTQEGVLSIFSWGTWGDCSDRFPGHPSSIDALLKVDEDTLLSGSSDGQIRVVQVQPDKLLGIIGNDHEGFPIEKLGFNANRHLVGSLTHSNFIRLWNAMVLFEDNDSDDNESEDGSNESQAKIPAKPLQKISKSNSTQYHSDCEWDDESERDDDDSDNDDNDIDEDFVAATINDRRKKRLKTENEKFFEDL